MLFHPFLRYTPGKDASIAVAIECLVRSLRTPTWPQGCSLSGPQPRRALPGTWRRPPSIENIGEYVTARPLGVQCSGNPAKRLRVG